MTIHSSLVSFTASIESSVTSLTSLYTELIHSDISNVHNFDDNDNATARDIIHKQLIVGLVTQLGQSLGPKAA